MTKSRRISIFKHIPTLHTPRLTLRRMQPSDYRDMYEYACLPSVTEYLLWYPHNDPDQTYRYLQSLQTCYKQGEFYDWAVVITETGKMIGTCGYTEFDHEHGRAEVGYVLNPAYWGHGFGPEAISAALEFAFRELDINRVEAHFIEGNDRSRRAAEKCGMTFEGLLRQYMFIKGNYRNIGICAVTRDRFTLRGCYRKEEKETFLSRLF
jgi:ribosomal-protein-alanine N-acetyltransferase